MRRIVACLFLVGGFVSVSAAPQATLSVSSPAFQNGGSIPAEFSCKGGNVSPPLRIANVPANAKQLAIAVSDPDAPSGTFTHWLVWNINPKTTDISAKTVPAGAAQGTNDFGEVGYGGPCPPSGTHRYYFRVFALDTELQLQAGAKAREFEKSITDHVIARGELMGRVSH